MPISSLCTKQPGRPYVAYSHVWADWLGTVIREALPGSAGLAVVGGIGFPWPGHEAGSRESWVLARLRH